MPEETTPPVQFHHMVVVDQPGNMPAVLDALTAPGAAPGGSYWEVVQIAARPEGDVVVLLRTVY